MVKAVRILILEDHEPDAELVTRELRLAGLTCETRRVETEQAFLEALETFEPDVILSDYALPQFDGLVALRLLRDRNIDIPFILCTGASNEETAVECMKEGAMDYILKSSLKRLPSALLNVLERSEYRKEERKANAALKESEENFRTIVETTNEWIWSADKGGRLTYSNPAVENILGYTPEELLGCEMVNFLSEQTSENIERTAQLLLDKNGWSAVVWQWRHKDGSHRYLESNAVPIFDANGEFSGHRGADRDITERESADKALIESEQRLQQAQKMEAIGRLTGGVAHDFNNLLMAILGNTQLALRKVNLTDPLHARLTEVEKAGKRGVELTRKLLAYSRRQHLQRKTINLNGNIAEIMTLLERVLGENVEISANYAGDLSAVFADPAQIEQVIMNLSINARDAMPDGGSLTIETRDVELDEIYCNRYPYVKPGRYVRVRVNDSGTGMDEETMAHIFEPFFTTKDAGKGTGLGLSMAYGIVKQHDGHIHVQSKPGFGTTFEIFLPVDSRPTETPSIPVSSPSIGGNETILVAEDEEPLRVLIRDLLEGLGYTVLLAKEGEEAVRLFAQNRERIDILLFDVVMPRMGGLEAYERICELDSDIPLILMTGYSSETVQNRFIKQERSAEKLGAVVIQKPYDINGLGNKIREAMAGPRVAAKQPTF